MGVLSACALADLPLEGAATTGQAPEGPPRAPATELPPVSATGLPVTTSSIAIPAVLEEFPTATVLLDGVRLLVAVADTEARRRQGLMNTTDLGDLDGMLFVYEEETAASFVMRNTLIPLDIAFFNEAGELEEVLSMTPCESEPCPVYPAVLPFRWALEAEPGSFHGLRPGALLEVPER